MFEVEAEQIKIELAVKQGGETHRLTHNLRQPTTSEWKEYDRRQATTGRHMKITAHIIDSREWLYNKLVKSVEGYTCKGQDIMDVTDWQAKVPVLHKSEVISRLGEIEDIEPGEELKNG